MPNGEAPDPTTVSDNGADDDDDADADDDDDDGVVDVDGVFEEARGEAISVTWASQCVYR